MQRPPSFGKRGVVGAPRAQAKLTPPPRRWRSQTVAIRAIGAIALGGVAASEWRSRECEPAEGANRLREGADVELKDGGEVLRGASDGYGAEGHVRQALQPLPEFDGFFPVVGAWIVGDAAAGMGMREDSMPLTGHRARFVPHVIAP